MYKRARRPERERASARPSSPHDRGDHRGDRDRVADADRRRDQGHPAGLATRGRLRRRADQPARLLHLQERLHPRRRVLPLALPRLRRAAATPSATSAPTSPASARCSPAAARRSACTSRCGCCATARTRRSRPASPRTRCAASPRMEDSADWIHRLKVVGIDLRDPTQVVALADEVAAAGPLDILDQQRRARPCAARPGAYAQPRRGRVGAAARRRRAARDGHLRPDHRGAPGRHRRRPRAARRSPTTRASPPSTRSAAHNAASHDRAGPARPATPASRRTWPAPPSTPAACCPTSRRNNSWTQKVEEVDPLELLEVQLCNSTAPFILVSRLRPAMRPRSRRRRARAYVVNVSAMEGQFSRRYKGAGPPAHQHGQGRAQHADPHQRAARCSRPTGS